MTFMAGVAIGLVAGAAGGGILAGFYFWGRIADLQDEVEEYRTLWDEATQPQVTTTVGERS